MHVKQLNVLVNS